MIGPSINSFVDYSPVLRLLFGQQIPVRSLPTMVPCPICVRKRLPHAKKSVPPEESFTLKVMNAPEGGQLWHCRICQKSWDSIVLIAKVRHKGQIRAAIDEIISSPDFNIPQGFITERAIEDYVLHYAAGREAVRHWANKTRERWSRHRDIHAILSEQIGIKVHLMETENSASERIGRWMHSTGRDEIQEMLNFGLKPNLPPKQFRTCLAVPWCNAPGRISALLLFGWQRKVRMWYPTDADNEDPGLMLLDAIPANAPRVIAVSSPYLALWLQYKSLQESNDPACVVAWHGRTDPRIWRQLGAEEVVFWDYQATPQLFYQALNVPGSKVSFMENLIFDVHRTDNTIEHSDTWRRFRNLLDVPVPSRKRLNDLINRRYDPWEAARDYLLQLEPQVVGPVLDHLQLENDQINRLLESCSSYEKRTVLERLFDRTFRHRELRLAGGIAMQYDGPHECKWLFRKGKHEEQISNAIVRLDHCVIDEETSDRFYTGAILHKGRRYSFSATPKELANEPLRVIMEAVELGGGESPIISNTHATKLWDYMFNFSPAVKTHRALTRVGWDKNGQAFLFPKFAIHRGEINERKSLGLSRDVLPGARLNIPEEPDPSAMNEWLEPNETNGTMWAVLTAALDNVLGFVKHTSPRGVGLVGSLAIKAGEKLAADVGLMTFNAEHIRKQFDEFEKAQRDHDLPAVATETDDRRLMPTTLSEWLVAPSPKNVLMAMAPAQAASAMLCGNWVLINTRNDDGDYYCESEVGGLLVYFLAHFQRSLGRLPQAKRSTGSTLAGLREWADSVGTRDSSFVFNYAASVIQDSGQEPMATRFVFLLAQLIHSGHLRRDYGVSLNDSGKGPAVVIDSENDRVYVSKQRVVEALTRRKLPDLDTVAVTDSLREENALAGQFGTALSNWAIELSFWERQIRSWAKTQEAVV